jgi:hypothetical protein
LAGNVAQVAGVEAAGTLCQRSQAQSRQYQPGGGGAQTVWQLDGREREERYRQPEQQC